MFIVSGANNTAPKGIDLGTYDGKSIVLDGSADYLSQTFGTPTNNYTYSLNITVKRAKLGATQVILFAGAGTTSNNYSYLAFTSTDVLEFHDYASGYNFQYTSNAKFRDTHKWYNITIAVATGKSPASDRIKIFVDGDEITSFSAETNPPLSYTSYLNSAVTHRIGATNPSSYLNGYVSRIVFIDGSAEINTAYGHESSDTGKWVLTAINSSSFTYGNNGGLWDFNNDRANTPDTTSTIYDQSGNSNNWTGNSLTAGSFTNDTPVDNYATLNALATNSTYSQATLSNGNLSAVAPTATYYHLSSSIKLPSTGKWYLEGTLVGAPNSANHIGVEQEDSISTTMVVTGDGANSCSYSPVGGAIRQNALTTATLVTSTSGDVIGIAVDMDNNKIWFAKNNTWMNSGDPVSGTGEVSSTLSSDIFFSAVAYSTGCDWNIDFGQLGFTYTPPTDFLALSSANLPIPDNLKPQDNANIVLYTGDGTAIGSGGNSITGIGFQPDFSWIKNRDTAQGHRVTDSVRGVTKRIITDATTAEGTDGEGLNSFDADGFTVGNDSSYNGNTNDIWSLNILADNTSGSSNTDGSITSTVATDEINFSIVTYTGTGANATVGHGLAEAPDLIIVKNTDGVHGWPVYHSSNTSAPETDILRLDGTDATADTPEWNDTAPTSSVFSLGTNAKSNNSGDVHVAYCFKFGDVFTGGSYTGNGSTDGVFIPSDKLLFFCNKRTSSSGYGWNLHDVVRYPNNPDDSELQANTSAAETNPVDRLDNLSNGIKLRTTGAAYNTSGATYIWWGIKKNGGQLAV